MLPTAEQVDDARELLRQFLKPTRLVQAERIGAGSNTRIFLKLETDLPTKSFKPRGALYALMTTLRQRSFEGGKAGEGGKGVEGVKDVRGGTGIKGVVAASTGNHGAAVAYAARMAQLPATIFLPQFPNPFKRARIVSLGAHVIEAESKGASLAEAADAYAREHDYYFLDDSSSDLVPCGTATIAAEIFDELPDADVLIVPMGDTALIRGLAAEAKRRHPGVRIVGVQAKKAPSYVRSWREGRVITTETWDTIADGLATCVPSESNVREIRELVDEVCLLSEDELLRGIRTLLFEERVVAEAAGAAATAAYLQQAAKYSGQTVVLLVTGANLPNELLLRAIVEGVNRDSSGLG